MSDARAVAYTNCRCGTLVRCSRLDPKTDQAKGLAALNSWGFVAECPACKTIVQLNFTNPSPIITSKG